MDVRRDGLGCVAITDKDYVTRVAATLIREMVSQFEAEKGYAAEAWPDSTRHCGTRCGQQSVTTQLTAFGGICRPPPPTPHRTKWVHEKRDNSMPFAKLDKALVDYQDPSKVDKIMKIQADLEETKEVLVSLFPMWCL